VDLGAPIDWPQAFPPQEYAERRRALRRALAGAGCDALYVTTPAHLIYLTGYDMVWHHLRCLTGVLVRADAEETLFFDGRSHATLIATTPEIREVVWFENEDDEREAVRTLVEACAARGLGRGRIALERWGYAPHATLMERLAQGLRGTGAEVCDGSHFLEEIRLVKTPREIAHMRRAARIADEAMAAARDALRPGIRESELDAILMERMLRAGGGAPAIRNMIGSGPRSGTHHGPATEREVRAGELVFIDFCACVHRYHVNLNRTFSLGPADPRWSELMERAAGCVDAIRAAVRLGEPLSRLQEVADAYVDAAGLRPHVWWIGGYALGIATPPDWCGRHWLAPLHGAPDRSLEPGVVVNFENQFDVRAGWSGGNGAAYIETLLVTPDGIEVLSELPRSLVAV